MLSVGSTYELNGSVYVVLDAQLNQTWDGEVEEKYTLTRTHHGSYKHKTEEIDPAKPQLKKGSFEFAGKIYETLEGSIYDTHEMPSPVELAKYRPEISAKIVEILYDEIAEREKQIEHQDDIIHELREEILNADDLKK